MEGLVGILCGGVVYFCVCLVVLVVGESGLELGLRLRLREEGVLLICPTYTM